MSKSGPAVEVIGDDIVGKLFILSVEEDDLEIAEKTMVFIESTKLVMCTDTLPAPLRHKVLCADAACRQVLWQGKSIELIPMEFDVFHLLARWPRWVSSQRETYEFAVPDSFGSSWTGISSIVYKLRHKLNADFIQTMCGKGYKFLPS